MVFERAAIDDIQQLTALRIAYLTEDHGALERDALRSIEANLPDYFRKHLNRDLIAYAAREGREIVACVFLLILEKPLSPAFLTGRIGNILNVYTRPDHRRRGCARCLLEMAMKDAVDFNLSSIELKATEDGYDLYRSLGFVDDASKYHAMKWTVGT